MTEPVTIKLKIFREIDIGGLSERTTAYATFTEGSSI